MRIPTVHLNGTSKRQLLHQFAESAIAIQNAMDVLSYNAPHGRDYYPQGEEAIEEALAEHRARISKLNAVRIELLDIAQAVFG